MLNLGARDQNYEKHPRGSNISKISKSNGLFLRKECLGASHITSLSIFYKVIIQNYDYCNLLCHLIRYLHR